MPIWNPKSNQRQRTSNCRLNQTRTLRERILRSVSKHYSTMGFVRMGKFLKTQCTVYKRDNIQWTVLVNDKLLAVNKNWKPTKSSSSLNELSFTSQEKSAPTKCQSLKVSVSTQCDIPRRRRLRKSDSRWTPEQKAAEIKEWTEALESFNLMFTEKRISQSQLSNGSSKFLHDNIPSKLLSHINKIANEDEVLSIRARNIWRT